MRAVNPILLAAMIQKKPMFEADLISFNFLSATTLNVTSFATPLVYGGISYKSAGYPICTVGQWEVQNTPEVPELELALLSTGADWTDNDVVANIKLAIHNGLFDGCALNLSKVYINPGNLAILGTVNYWNGWAGKLDLTPLGANITFKGMNIKFDQSYPRNIIQGNCIHPLYGNGCAPNPGETGGGPLESAHTFSGTVLTASTIAVNWTADPSGGTYANFANGTVTFTSGAADGQTVAVRASSAAGFQLNYPLFGLPVPGDTFTIVHGCDHTRGALGCTFFNNLQHIRNFDLVPPAELGV